MREILDAETEDRRRKSEVEKYRKYTGGGPPADDVNPPDPDLIRKNILSEIYQFNFNTHTHSNQHIHPHEVVNGSSLYHTIYVHNI